MDNYLKYLPPLVMGIVAIPFFLFLTELARSGFSAPWLQAPSQFSLVVFGFVFGDTLYGQAVAYLQAPFLLALVLRYHAPAPKPGGGLSLPSSAAAWVFVGVCGLVLISAYLSRYYITSDDCTNNDGCIRILLAQDIDMAAKTDTVYSAFREYCSVLMASTISLLAIMFGVAPVKVQTP